jgi:predicted ATP-grasp superfamily ATP-dependent carboligase
VRALIVDEGRERSSVAAARALRQAGWTVGSGSPYRSLASRSAAVSRWHRIAHSDEGEDAFLESLAAAIREGGYDAAFVGWDRAVTIVSGRREELPVPVGYGPHDRVLAATDKSLLAPVARECGIEVPRSAPAADYEREQWPGPVVVKPARSAGAGAAAQRHDSAASALARARSLEAQGMGALIQEYVDGQLLALSLVVGPSGVVSIAQQVARHVWPQPAGVTARGLSVRIDPALRAAAERLLERLRWQGLAQLQFLADADGRMLLIDFNPRFYGSLALAVRAGANHPDAWGRLIAGLPVTPAEGRPGARFQWLTRDLRASRSAPRPLLETARALALSPLAAHSLWSYSEPWLAPRFLADQAGRAVRERLGLAEPDGSAPSGPEPGANAALHGLPPAAAERRVLRARPIPPRPLRLTERAMMKAGRLTYEAAWLRPLQQVREAELGDAARGAPRLLVRVDEFPYYAGLDNAKFGREASERFHAVMAEEGVPHLMAVVPQWTHLPLQPGSSGGRPLDDEDRALLERMRADGVTIAQHGRTHRTRDAHPRRHSELCGLDHRELGTLLDEGRAALAAAGFEPRVLVPPFNRFDASQWDTLAERYEVVTGGPESVPLMGFHGGPLWRGDAVYLPCYAPLYSSAAEILPAVERLIDEQIGTWVPVVLHMGWEIDDGCAALRRLARRIAPYAVPWEQFLEAARSSRARR